MSDKSTGQIIGTVVGAVIGFFIPGGYVALGAALGGMVGGAIDPPKGPSITGPRLSDQSAQTVSYGVDIPRCYSTIATYGSVVWVEGDKIKETVKKEDQGGKGGGGGAEITSYEYSATFAVALCRGPIAGIKRIWVGPNLVYSSETPPPGFTPIDLADLAVSSLFRNFFDTSVASEIAKMRIRIYLGDETQQPDPRMQADKGVDNVSAMRGFAYVVFEDLPLKDYGNTLMAAQIKAEVVVYADDPGYTKIFSTETIGDSDGWSTPAWSFPFTQNLEGTVAKTQAYQGGAYTATDWLCVEHSLYRTVRHELVVDPASRCEFMPVPAAFYEGDDYFCFNSQDAAYFFIGNDMGDDLGESGIYETGELVGTTTAKLSVLSIEGYYQGLLYNSVFACMYGTTVKKVLIYRNHELVTSFYITHSSTPRWVMSRDTGIVYFLYADVSGTGVHVIRYWADSLAEIDTFDAASAIALDEGIYIENLVLCTVTKVNTDTVLKKYDLDTLQLLSSEIIAPAYSPGSVAQGLGSMIVVGDVGATRLLDVFTNGIIDNLMVPLADIVTAEVELSNLVSASDIDVTSLVDDVRGYKVGSTGSIRNALSPLQAAWPFDVVPAGYKINFIRRGLSSIATVAADDLGAKEASSGIEPRLTQSREMDSQLPVTVAIQYLDSDREYGLGEQRAGRLNTAAVNLINMELPIVLTATEAAQKAEILLYMYWMERDEYKFSLPPSFINLEPADVITLTLTDESHELRLTEMSYLPSGVVECSARPNATSTYTSTAVGESALIDTPQVIAGGPMEYALLDIPALRDAYDRPGFVGAMTGYTENWPGGVIFQSADSGQTWSRLQAFVASCTMGYALNTLGQGRTDIIDSAGVLSVWLLAGTISSVSESSMLNGQNYMAYGVDGRWEIIAAENCVAEVDGSYTLTNLLRGRFGTEWATGLHAVNDIVVLLTDTDLAWIGAESSSIGLSRLYRGVTSGRSIDNAPDVTFAYSAANLKPLSPVHLNMDRNMSTLDWTFTATRRTRVGGEMRDYIDAPLGETSEAYELDIYDEDFTSLKRTVTGLTTPSFVYTSAFQSADFGGPQAGLGKRWYQVSSAVGRGFPAELSLYQGIIDPNAANVVALMHFDAANGSTVFTEVLGKTITTYGNAQHATAQKIAGSASLVCDGNGDYVEIAGNANHNLSGDFTIEFWVRFNSVTSSQYILGLPSSPYLFFQIYRASTSVMSFAYTNIITGTTVLAINTWYHVAMTRSGVYLRGFINGNLEGTYSPSSANNSTSPAIQVGCMPGYAGATVGLNGYLDELRITNGVARYTASFTPPTPPFEV